MSKNKQPHWHGQLPHLRAEFDVEALQHYLSYLGCIIPAELFAQVDSEFYQEKYLQGLPKIKDPAQHFFQVGWTLRHQPNQWFETDFYLNEYGDVCEAGVNPFEHFLIHGYRENRLYSGGTNSSLLRRLNLRSEVDPLNNLLRITNQPPIASLDQVCQEINQNLISQGGPTVVAFGHDNYMHQIGGIQLVAGIEQQKFAELNTDYIYIFPSHPRLALAPQQPTPTFQAIVNGQIIPLRFPLPGLLQKLEPLEAVIIHSIFGHEPILIAEEIAARNINHFIWWIHDYSIHCENHLLAHNNLRSCNDPPIDSQMCRVCIHGSRRHDHVTRTQYLLQAAPWQFIAPSETAQLKSVSGSTKLSAIPKVVAHGELLFDGQRNPSELQNRKLRIAFVGQPVQHKGWKVFQQFVEFSNMRKLEVDFFHFGSIDSKNRSVVFVDLSQTSKNIGLTTSLLRQNQIDAAFIWSIHQETFNLVTYESIAAGCIVITSKESGNIQAAAQKCGSALIYGDESELFGDDHVLSKITQMASRGMPTGKFVFTGTTAAFLQGQTA
jgi:hypothetical protein